MKGQKKDGSAKKSTKGLPRITDKVLAGGEALAQYQAAVAKLSAEAQKDCLARLEKAQKEGRKSKAINWATVFTGRKADELIEAEKSLKVAMKVAADSELAESEAELARLTAKVAGLKVATATVAVAAPVPA